MNVFSTALLVAAMACVASAVVINSDSYGACLEKAEKDYKDTGNVPDGTCVKFAEEVKTDAKAHGPYPYTLNFKAGDTDLTMPEMLKCLKAAIKAAGGKEPAPASGCKPKE